MPTTAASFGDSNFAAAALGRQDRNGRLADLVDRMVRHPGGSLPDKLNQPADLRAFYRLMKRPEVTHAALLGGHADRTRRQFFLHVARLGGHQNRKADGLPGWITLWRGWMKLQALVDGYRAARKKYRRQHGQT